MRLSDEGRDDGDDSGDGGGSGGCNCCGNFDENGESGKRSPKG